MQVAPEQHAVVYPVLAAPRVRNDVCCFQYRARVLTSHGAGSAIGITHSETEQALAKAGLYFNRRAIACWCFFDALDIPIAIAALGSFKTFAEQSVAFAPARCVGLALLDT